MSDSILNDIKRMLGLQVDDDAFDVDVTTHINATFLELSQIGVGPAAGFMITDAVATWEDLLGADLNLNAVKTLVFMKVRLVFDPPDNPAVILSYEKVIEKLEWRLNVHYETTGWSDPQPRVPDEDVFGRPLYIDGGVG